MDNYKSFINKNLNKLFKKTKRMNIIALICAEGRKVLNKNLLKFKNTIGMPSAGF